jgi:cell division septum initiation protein DivIVA
MSDSRLSEIKDRLSQASLEPVKEDLDWLVKRVEELETEIERLKKDNEWLKKELAYAEVPGEIGY